MSDGVSDHFLQFVNVKKSYDQKTLVVKDFNLDVAEGEFVTLLGPSGSGKTTVLMMLAGFESVTSGDIIIRNASVARTAPYKRNIGMVFQNYALFPHMTVAENLRYPLAVRKMSRSEIDRRVAAHLDLVELAAFADRYPGQLSGGQKQRVALARALVFEPTLVLMDEPLGALDKKLREQMQFEISRLHHRLGFTVVYVTHDQAEALTMSNRIAVFNKGIVQQCARPDDLYERPSNAFVASFIGENNLIPGKVGGAQNGRTRVDLDGGGAVLAQHGDSGATGSDCIVSVRPEKLFINDNDGAHDNTIPVTFSAGYYVGDFIRYFFKLRSGSEIAVKVLNDQSAPKFTDGETAHLAWSSADCFAFRKE